LRYPQRRRPINKDHYKYVYGRFIKEPKVYVIDHENNNIGLVDTKDALDMARAVSLDLVLISQGRGDKPSTCKILDLGKYKYEQEKREKVAKKKQRENAVKIKEVKFRPGTDENDLKTKARQLQEFVDEGNRLKVTIMFRGREMAHKNIGAEQIGKFASMISARVDTEPAMSGRNMTAILIKSEQKVEVASDYHG